MTSIPERETIIQLIQQANTAGARLERACEEAGISLRTYRRWYQNGKTLPDKRPEAVRPEPANKLTPQEREKILELCNQPEYSQQPPSQIVPDLLDQGIYVASESSFYRCQWPLFLTLFWPIKLTHPCSFNPQFFASVDSFHLPA